MEPRFSMKKKKNLFPKIITLTAVVVLGGLTLFNFKFANKKEEKVTKTTVSKIEETLKENSVTKTKFIYKCGHEKNESKRTEDQFIGKTKKEIEKQNPTLTITSFSPEEMCLEKAISKDCQNHFIIRLMENRIYVFRTNDENTVYKKREINVNDLSNEDVKILTEGIRVDSELELLEMMESFS